LPLLPRARDISVNRKDEEKELNADEEKAKTFYRGLMWIQKMEK
jgi:hypothetical protein